ncbi:MAG: sodium-translocating pyrophosphatase [Candidatus Bipolaricaulaceae bacterium]
MGFLIVIPAVVAVAALAWAAYANWYVMRKDRGTPRMQELQDYIREGAMAFMLEEARVMALTMVVVGAILWALFYWEVAVSFWIGAVLSMTAGFVGMSAATRANARTTQAARSSFKEALNVAMSGGSVMGMAVAGLALGGLVLVIWLFRHEFDPATINIQTKAVFGIPGADVNFIKAALIVSAYSMGASLVALFDRVGGGIYTKAADMAADMVGKVEAHIDEDDPRNPASIADNVGDNVGDVGGLGADLLESFIGSVISVMVMAMYIFVGRGNEDIQMLLSKFGMAAQMEAHYWWFALLPLLYVAGGVVASLLGVVYVRSSRRQENMQAVLMNGTRIAAMLTATFAAVTTALVPTNFTPFWTMLMGLVSGVLIGLLSEYFTSNRCKPTRDLALAYDSGPAVGVTEGMAVGMISTLLPVVVIAGSTIGAYQLGGLLGVAYAALGMLSFVGMTVSVDSYGPIADNAGGISTMAGLDPAVRQRTDELDAIGNTTAAIGKGFAIGSAAFAALGLIAAYIWSAAGTAGEVHIPTVSMISPDPTIGGVVLAALVIGAMVPYVFSALLIRAVSRTANVMVQEIRRQFRESPKILTGEEPPDFKRCITITASGGVRRMVLPSMLALTMPLLMGFIFGRYALAGFLVGALLSAIQLAIYCANAGGAMDNAKKYVEEGHYGGKGSEAHAAGVIGDTVGDPLKDTVGPSLDILIKLMSVIALLFASLFPIGPIFI